MCLVIYQEKNSKFVIYCGGDWKQEENLKGAL